MNSELIGLLVVSAGIGIFALVLCWLAAMGAPKSYQDKWGK